MISTLTLILNAVSDACITKLIDSTIDKAKDKLRKDPAKIAFKKALGTAIQQYAASQNMRSTYLVEPLLEKENFLTLPSVVEEITHLLRFDREPDAQLIGRKWKEAFDDPPTWCDFTYEAQTFLTMLTQELSTTDVFRPVFDTASLTAIATNTTISAQSLTHIEMQLAQISTLMQDHFGRLAQAFLATPYTVYEHIRDYTSLLHEKGRDFVGRQFIDEAFTHFIEQYRAGYFFLQGDAGIGKSAFAAHMVLANGYVHHFNIRSENINTAEKFLDNICAQLIAKYHLDYTYLPPEATRDASFLRTLLEKISAQLHVDEKVVIVLDALDEVESTGVSSGANVLSLPMNLPPHVYFLVTMRHVPLNMRIECDFQEFEIVHDSVENLNDIRTYLAQVVHHQGIQRYITAQNSTNHQFIASLTEKSEGNFIYLHYVLPEIEQGDYQSWTLTTLPRGLNNYYEDHWRRMQEKHQNWFEEELPVIATLTAVYEPVSLYFVTTITRVHPSRISTILLAWNQFLHVTQVVDEGKTQDRYSIYHLSFHDFLAQKKDVGGELSVLEQAHGTIAMRLLHLEEDE